ncbi:hypothetical protein CSA56_17530 [candidate division KSB3 bacterium]|uniref:Uncharacterized protein n=1 Tax=candidate division KSB3 bacterium TaxID=2044937 RepID=A0A2G6K7L7_9BACT|nr:MAG: hypothetical protein CSA56_17530 [candidate division KSB3 bacterium]
MFRESSFIKCEHMVYIIILLVLVFALEVLILKKGVKAARKNANYLAAEQRPSVPVSQANKKIQKPTHDHRHSPSGGQQKVSPLPSEVYENIITFPGGPKENDMPDSEHELRRSASADIREKTMAEMIQEIRGANSSDEAPPLQDTSGSPEEFDQLIEDEKTENPQEVEDTEAEYNNVDEYVLEENDGMDIYSARDVGEGEDAIKDVEAIEEAETVVSPEELLKSGIRFVKQGKLDDGITTLEQAVAITPDKAEAHFNLGIAYTLKESTPQAISSYQRAIELDADYGKALFNLGTLYLKQGKLDLAIDNLDRAVKFLADPMKALWNLYEAYRCREHFSKALTTLQQLIELEPNDASLHNHLGICYVKLGDYKKAIASWNRSISLGASSLLIFYNLGKTYELCGDELAAIDQYEKFLHLNTKKSEWKELVDEVKERLESLQKKDRTEKNS